MQRANAIAVCVDERPRSEITLMTPARRAGLEALEREFSDLLAVYHQRQAAAQSAAA